MPRDTAVSRRWRHDRSAVSSLITPCILTGFVLAALVRASAGESAVASSAQRGAAADSIGIRLVDVPNGQVNDPRARIYIVDHLAPGMIVDRRIEVSNTTSFAANVVLYPAAAGISAGLFLGSAGHTQNALSRWTSIVPSEAEVPPGGNLTASVRVVVPRDATSGERYGAIWAQVGSTPVAGGGITQISRVGIRMYISIGSGGPPASNFVINSLTAERSSAGQPMVLASVHNTGGLALDMSGKLQLFSGPGGLSAGPFPAALGTTLGIGDTEPVTISLDRQLPAGPWDARITLQSGLLERRAEATITFPDVGASPPVKTTSIGSTWIYPALIGLAALLLLTLAVLVVTLRRLRGRSAFAGL
jgi:hypothetical protein